MYILPFYFGFILTNSTVNCYVVLLVSALKVCSVLLGPGTDSDLKNQNCFYMYHNCIMHNLKMQFGVFKREGYCVLTDPKQSRLACFS